MRRSFGEHEMNDPEVKDFPRATGRLQYNGAAEPLLRSAGANRESRLA